MPARLAIYTRLSKYTDPTNLPGTDRQEKDCRAVAEVKGWPVAKVYTDLDVSAYRRGTERPSYEAMLEDLRTGAVDGVLVWKLDRLVRRSAEFERLWLVCEEAGATLASATDPIDTSTELGMVIVRVLVAFAQLESATMSLRIRRAKEESAKAGNPRHGGRRPYGLTKDWAAIVPTEAERIRAAADRVIAGESLRSIVLDWRADGVLNPSGLDWSHQGLRSMLLSRRLEGMREFRGEVVAEGCWPAILDASTAAQVRATLSDPSRHIIHIGRSYLLTGLVWGWCGHRLRGGMSGAGKPRYLCPSPPQGCGRCASLAAPLEAEVVARLVRAVDATAVERARSKRTGGYVAAADAVLAGEAKLAELARSWAADEIDATSWAAARKEVEARLTDARRRLRRVEPVLSPWAGHGSQLAIAWESMTVAGQRAVLGSFIDRITLAFVGRRTRVFDPDRVRIEWRRGTD
jgi:site-specific DNA recombinase